MAGIPGLESVVLLAEDKHFWGAGGSGNSSGYGGDGWSGVRGTED